MLSGSGASFSGGKLLHSRFTRHTGRTADAAAVPLSGLYLLRVGRRAKVKVGVHLDVRILDFRRQRARFALPVMGRMVVVVEMLLLRVDAMLTMVMAVMVMVPNAVRHMPEGGPGQNAAHAERTRAAMMVPVARPIAGPDRIRIPVQCTVVVVIVVPRSDEWCGRCVRMLMSYRFRVARRIDLGV